QLAAHHPDLGVTYLRDLPLADVLSRLAAVPDHSIVFFVRQSIRSRVLDVDPLEALADVLRVSRAPVFTAMEEFMGRGVVGGNIWRYEADARRLARMVVGLVNGASLRD